MFGKWLMVVTVLFGVAYSQSCSFDINGATYDLSPLVAQNGSYVWTQEVNISGIVEEMVLELQVCGPVTNSVYTGCSTNSAVNAMIKTDTSKCASWGDGTVYAVDENPEKDGVFMTYYHGDYLNDITAYSTLIYFVCDQKSDIVAPFFEHYRECEDASDGNTVLGGQFHFAMPNKYVCT